LVVPDGNKNHEPMKYDSATITAHFNDKSETIDLETVSGEQDMVDQLWAAFTDDEDEQSDEERDDFPGNLIFTDPQGFAVHLFDKMPDQGETKVFNYTVSANFDDLLSVWSDETDNDRREAMGEYLEDMGADDLSDFDEAYQGQFSSGADFAEHTAEELGEIPKDLPSWIVIDWEQSWDGGLRFDYHITDSGHVFRNL